MKRVSLCSFGLNTCDGGTEMSSKRADASGDALKAQ